MSLPEILAQVASYAPYREEWEPPRYVTVTGGEPLAQKACLELLNALCDTGYEVSLETGGAMDVAAVDPRVVKILDIKTPGSDESDKNLYGNIEYLTPRDQVKFVLCSREDYVWAKEIMARYDLPARCEILFSPSHQQMAATSLADWILEDRLPVRLQIQLHKYLWGNTPGK